MTNRVMKDTKEIFTANRQWSRRMQEADPDFFSRLENLQSPQYLWIGCSDSRVPANQITGLGPGEVFVHRNVANLAPGEDSNCQAVIEYAVGVLGVTDIIVCGHYGCGGVLAALNDDASGHALEWIGSIVNLRNEHAEELAALPTQAERHARLCELNVVAQVDRLSRSKAVRSAWSGGHSLNLHGWIYKLSDGLLQDLGVTVSAPATG